MKYTIKKETKPNLLTFGKYKAVAVHDKTIESQQILKETAQRMHLSEGTIHGVIMELAEVVGLCLEGMRPHAAELGLLGTGA